MVYIDTSALVPVFIRESKSEAVMSWLESSGERLAISEWSLAECASAAAIKISTGEITPNLAKQLSPECNDLRSRIAPSTFPGGRNSAVQASWRVTTS